MAEEDGTRDQQLNDIERVQRFVEPRLERAERDYSRAMTSLWLGNAGGAVATLGFIGAIWRNTTLSPILLAPLWCFVLGFVAMGAGTICGLIADRKVIRKIEEATSVWTVPVGAAQRPSEHIGLTISDPRTLGACASAVLFVAGSLCGLVGLSRPD
jgi:hypothetical protein